VLLARLPLLLLLPASPPGAPGALLPRVCRGPPLRVGGLDDEPRATPASSKPSVSCGSGGQKDETQSSGMHRRIFLKRRRPQSRENSCGQGSHLARAATVFFFAFVFLAAALAAAVQAAVLVLGPAAARVSAAAAAQKIQQAAASPAPGAAPGDAAASSQCLHKTTGEATEYM
jgi:hypothetical protein